MAKLKKQIFSYSHTDRPQVIRINGIYAEIKWYGGRNEIDAAKLDGISLSLLSTISVLMNLNADRYAGGITLPVVRDREGNPIQYNETLNFFPTSKSVIFYVLQVYLDPNE